MAGHAILSPSSSARWMLCAGSVVLEADIPNQDNEYSKEGTLAHAVAAHCLEKGIKDCSSLLFLDMPGKDGKPKTEIVTMEMRGYVQEYLDFIYEKSKGHELMIEQGLDLSGLTGEKNSFGTADTVLLYNDGETIGVWDFKYGFQEVSADANSQLRIYGSRAADVLSALGDFKKFELGIYQPRINNIDSETITAEEMKKFEDEVREAVKRVDLARKSNSLDGFLNPGKKQCQWCRAAGTCPALAMQVVEATGADFEDETQTELIAPVNLAAAGAKLDLVEIWSKGVRGSIERELFSGGKVKGWKLVEGKKGNRDWIDEDSAKKEFIAVGVAVKDIEETSLLSVAKLEKKIKGNKKALDKLPSLYSQKPGKPSVALASDKRPAYTLKPEEDFENVE